jgi:hypothetical protein
MEPPDPGGPTCMRDALDEPAAAGSFVDGMAEGFLCPVEDRDWYAFELGPSERIVTLALGLSTMRSPVEPTYAVWTDDGGAAGEVVATPEADDVGGALEDTFCLAPGAYFVSVRDQNDDAQDLRNGYTLALTTAPEPDGLEPNEDLDGASPLALGAEVEGYIGCRGDEDYYAVDVPEDSVLRLRLTAAAAAAFQPTVRLLNVAGEPLLTEANRSGGETVIDLFRVLPTGGRWVVAVSDDDGRDADFTVPYQLLVEAVPDTDPNEPNDGPEEATALAAADCGDGWTDWVDVAGTIASPSDNDWFVVPVPAGCEGGLLEAELRVSSTDGSDGARWALQEEVQASLTVVVEDPTSPCAEDSQCRSLSRTCEDQWDCERVFNACATEGLCVGAAACLPGSVCAANQVERHYERRPTPVPLTGPPPPNEAIVSTPLFGGPRVYLRVSDFQADGGRPDARYSLRYRTRRDPDAGDRGASPNNLYSTRLVNELPVEESLSRARPMTVQGPGGCADMGVWTEGRIGYENDLDWFTYGHPCPGMDCMIRLHYAVDGGDVDVRWASFTGTRDWFGFDLGSGRSGTFGGVEPTDQCVYAYFQHDNPYYVVVRDVATPTRDWDPDQRYRFCLERVFDGCVAPCMDFGETGCGVP